MSNPWEKPPENKKKETTSKEKNLDAIKKEIERRTGKKLPENEGELFRNFDELVPKEIKHIDFKESGWHVGVKEKSDESLDYSQAAIFTPSRKISREEIKADLEKEVYGATMEDVKKFFEEELEKIDNDLSKEQESIDRGYKKASDNKLGERHAKASELFNQLNFGSLEVPLADIELRINDTFTNESKRDVFRKFAERLSAEVYKNKPKSEVTNDDIRETLQKIEKHYTSGVKDKYDKEYNDEHFGKIFEDFDKGKLDRALKEIEFNVGWIQEKLEDRKNKDRKNISENSLKERYGENFVSAVNKELEKLRSYRKFLKSGESKNA